MRRTYVFVNHSQSLIKKVYFSTRNEYVKTRLHSPSLFADDSNFIISYRKLRSILWKISDSLSRCKWMRKYANAMMKIGLQGFLGIQVQSYQYYASEY